MTAPPRIRIRRALMLLGWALAGPCGVSHAQAPAPTTRPDTTQSPACRQALETVQAQESAALAAKSVKPPASAPAGPSPEALLAMRERAARICLGPGSSGPPPSQRTLQAPVTVSPVAPTRLPVTGQPVAPAPAPTSPVVPTRTDPLLTVVGCDATGCWASDGSRLEKSGPNLIGPRGTCTLQGAVLRCPQ
ncbi:hypothetical protein [Ideonella sp.]|uniref:hypothetical protein n=1 Tax=Ideonella sp. TaxID=1929293 RepID=UPI0035B0803B